ncbi:MAG TPA: DegT/DnrJ/EryC1/StrS family aminotransferase [Candidatus Saccharimonadales bacterium]|nr:DegT/DnrJ/EryC1/StrS family aminotransferase [Candidatus Saccharimonadales bacterium]
MSASAQSGQQHLINNLDATSEGFDFLDLKAQFATIREEVIFSVLSVMESQKFILGDEVRLFEEEVAAMMSAKYAVGCASGSDALMLALMAAGIQTGDEVITTPFTFVATAGSIARLGAKPVFVDIDPDTFNIDVKQIESAVTSATQAIMPIHLFGLPADLDPILSLAKAKDIAVIEDAAQAIGAKYNGRYVGTIGTFGCFSFFPSKNLGCAGDGGLVTTEDAILADRLRLLRVHGSRKKYQHEIVGVNSRLDSLQAAILRVKLGHLGNWTSARQMLAMRYAELFEAYGLVGEVKLPHVADSGSEAVFNQFTIRSKKRDELRDFLRAAGIPSEIYYPVPLHLQPAFNYLGYGKGQFPESERACQEVLSLPIYPELSSARQVAVVRGISDFYKTRL